MSEESPEVVLKKETKNSVPLIKIRNARKWFPIKAGLFSPVSAHVRAVDGVDLDIQRGETVGIVGESGCGKTTLGRLVMGLIPMTEGTIQFGGKDIGEINRKELRRRLQIVFQDPGGSMNPRMSVRSIIGEPLLVNGLADGAELTKKVAELLSIVGLQPNHMTRFPHEFSGGQKQRIALARALSLDPEFILLDEPTSALDVSVQAQVLNLLDSIQKERGLTFIFITHSLNVVNHISDRVAVMYLGKIVEIAETDDLFANPAHPYTHALLSAIPQPSLDETKKERIVLSGDVPSPANPPSGCSFHTRCPIAVAGKCDVDEPELQTIIGGHKVACHFPVEAGGSLPVLND
ncbi:MAG: ATP-binding cassette domain-containing protein [Candidatus Poseidoniales archaeon]|nr:ATP-binding cassette domain-containing protein [Candidatus Poseidoniales archaeon]MEC8939176.1 oligopeptide/dipeptide ABC transporter ATP-binding protein [Candidatus Thermoplasmatota archaeon]MEC8954600.1 oligopeptide/dipeptide ABC transporter ATP-binding protein [Candidatus Thermoplasmatota archaeon]MEC9351061.1 oligopeptide/dipeptide ABC transporter ATP-binding protein [Candidatus Thermoplasmatota archaeon]MEC9393808.1 oligopeptide/dipeptide ABC transporter ATP-binding protein [Candidatus |tara:strand:+ start:5834 stop:6877 length:1044 start_codon:yes stop_codon:yes gene_type:complete